MTAVSVDSKAAQVALTNIAKQMPFAISTATNDLAFQVQRSEQAGIKATFANPRPFTQKSVGVNRANKSTLSATISIRPEVAKYLMPYETGGLHVLPGQALLKPVDAKLDQYGQLPKGSIKRLTAQPNIFVGTIDTAKSGPISGVWERLSVTRTGNARRKRRVGGGAYHPVHGALKLLVRFGNALPVKQHLDFYKRGAALIASNAADAFGRAIAKAIATSR